MKVGIPLETRPGETRVAATPDSVKKLTKRGLGVRIERGAGLRAGFTDAEFTAAGAELVDRDTAFASEIVLKVHRPAGAELGLFKSGTLLICFIDPSISDRDGTLAKLAQAGVSTMGMELVPRTSRAQSMDALSSQANIAGYRAVLEATLHYSRFIPMMMTSAGSAKPARLAVLGAGVAGLQAIATARRLGAAVEAFDVRAEVREQILSLGAKFMDIELKEEGSGQGGYAKALSDDAQARLQQALGERLKKCDIIISTANIPGRKAPVLITEDAVKGMRHGSVIIDMAAANGGNCPLTEADQIVEKHGVRLVGITNFPALVPADASSFYARNLITLLFLMIEGEATRPTLNIKLDDDIVLASLATYQGAVCLGGKAVNPAGAAPGPAAASATMGRQV